jgi:hypothetical protein
MYTMYSTAQKGPAHRMGMIWSPSCMPSQIQKDAEELLRMISPHDCRAQNLLLVFTSAVKSGGTHKSWQQPHQDPELSPWSHFRRAKQRLGT